MDSIAVLGWVGRVSFWVLLFVGREELGWKGIGAFVALWGAGWLALRRVSMGPFWFMAVVAVLDVFLVLIIFKGDVRIR